MKKLITIVCCLTLLIACKNEETKPVAEVKVEEVKAPSKLVIEFDYDSDKADVIQCAFNGVETSSSQKVNHLITDNTADSNTFEMFGDFVPASIQLKFGKTPKKIVVSSMNITYEDQTLAIDGSNITNYFVFNKFCEYNKETNTIVTKMVDGKHFPSISLKRPHINKLFKF